MGVKGLILAAGFGTRMRPVTQALAKPCLPVGAMPLVGYAARLLAHHGITDVAVNLHHAAASLREVLGDGRDFGIRLTLCEEPTILGTGGALATLWHGPHAAAFAGHTLVVINGDTLVDLDLNAIVAEHRTRRAMATMVLRDDPMRHLYGQIGLAGHGGRICQILDIAVPGTRAALQRMFTGVHVLEPSLARYVEANAYSDVVRGPYTRALLAGERLFGTLTDGVWADLGTPARYRQVNADALAGRIRLRHVDPMALMRGDVRRDMDRFGLVVSAAAGVHARVTWRPPALVAHGARIGEGAMVGPGAIVGPDAAVGAGAQLAHSVVLARAEVAAGERLDGWLIGRAARLQLPA